MQTVSTAASGIDRQQLRLRKGENTTSGGIACIVIERHDCVICIVAAKHEDTHQRFVVSRRGSHCAD